MGLTGVRTSLRVTTPLGSWSLTDELGTHTDKAIDAVTVNYGRSHGLGHPEPGNIKFAVLTPVGAAAPGGVWEAEVTIEVWCSAKWGEASIIIANGWITELDRVTITLADGTQRWRWTVACQDILGRAASTQVDLGDRPAETATARMNAINAVSPAGVLVDGSQHYGVVAARTAGAASCLDIIRRTVDYQALAGEGFSIIVPLELAAADAFRFNDALHLSSPSGDSPTELPARAVEDTGRRLDRAAKTDVMTVTYYTDSGAEQTAVLVPPFATGTSSELSMDTDQRIQLPDENLLNGLRATLAEAQHPTAALPGTPRVLVEQLSHTQAHRLMSIARRQSTVVYIAGPDDLDRVHVLLGGTITITGRELYLAVDFQPARTCGIRQLKLNEARDPSEAPGILCIFRGTYATFRKSTAVRIGR